MAVQEPLLIVESILVGSETLLECPAKGAILPGRWHRFGFPFRALGMQVELYAQHFLHVRNKAIHPVTGEIVPASG
jgi:hypothetical protein